MYQKCPVQKLMRDINHTISIHSNASNLKPCGWALTCLWPTFSLSKRKKKTSIHSQESTSTFLARFLTSWQNEDSLIWYMAIKILLSQQSITNYILKNGYTLFHNALIMARWWLNYEKMASLCQYVGCLNVWQIMNRKTKVVEKARHPKRSMNTPANLQSNVNKLCSVFAI